MTQQWRSLKVEGPDEAGVARLLLHRPARSNALDPHFFAELPLAVAHLDSSPAVRVIIIEGAGKNFCAGIDLSSLSSLGGDGSAATQKDIAFSALLNIRNLKHMQAAFTSVEDCRKPVIAAIHGACVGAGVDLVTACDLRYCSTDCFFCVKEVDLAMAADTGTLQRLPRLVGYGHAMDLSLTGRRLSAADAKAIGLVNGVFQSKDAMSEEVGILARNIASKVANCRCGYQESPSQVAGFVCFRWPRVCRDVELCNAPGERFEGGCQSTTGKEKASLFEVVKVTLLLWWMSVSSLELASAYAQKSESK